LREVARTIDRAALGAASDWRRVLGSEDAAANAANRYIRTIADSYSRELTISERQFRQLREGVTVEKAIEDRRVRLRPYASQSTQRAAQGAIERNKKNPIRAQVREKKRAGIRVSEKEFRAHEARFFEALGKKNGRRYWRDASGKIVSEENGRATVSLPREEFDRIVNFYRANRDLYAPLEEDLFRRAGGPSLKVSRRAYRNQHRAA
jgi:hypothetical protein